MPIIASSVWLESISVFLHRALSVRDGHVEALEREYSEEEWDDFGEVDTDRATNVMISYQEIVTRAAISELNAIVEYELKWRAKAILQKSEKKVPKRLSRGVARTIIESELGIDISSLSGFTEVDEIRKISNAYKHDAGYSGEYEPRYHGFIEIRYPLDPELVKGYLQGAREFILGLPGRGPYLGEDVRFKD